MIPSFSYFVSKWFYLLCIWLQDSLCTSFPYLLIKFFSLFWNDLFYFYCLVLSWYLFRVPSFITTSRFIVSCCIFCCSYVAFYSLSQYPIFFPVLSSLTVAIDFVSVSNLISHSGLAIFSCSSEAFQLFHRLDLLLHRLDCFGS